MDTLTNNLTKRLAGFSLRAWCVLPPALLVALFTGCSSTKVIRHSDMPEPEAYGYINAANAILEEGGDGRREVKRVGVYYRSPVGKIRGENMIQLPDGRKKPSYSIVYGPGSWDMFYTDGTAFLLTHESMHGLTGTSDHDPKYRGKVERWWD